MMPRPIKILGIIPARGGSKRIPRKNIARVAGKPMIAYAIAAARGSRVLDACIMSTDDSEIARVAASLGADVPFLRPKQYARDASPDIEYARHALQWLAAHRGWRPEIAVILPPDCPARTSRDIDRAVRFLIKGKYDSVRTLIRPVPPVPYKAMWTVRDTKRRLIAPLFPWHIGRPSQSLPEYLISVGMAYVTLSKYILRGAMWGPRIGGLVMEGRDAERCIEVDEPEQLRQAEKILTEMRGKKKHT